MKASELRQKNKEELVKFLQERLVKMAELKFELAEGKTKNLKELREIKTDIARVKTILRELEL